MATNQYPYVEYNGSVAQLLKKGFEGAKPEALASVNDPAMREFICMCFGEDTRILTDAGMQFLDEIESRVRQGEVVLYGCYEVKRKALVYRPGQLVFPPPPKELLEFTSQDEAQRWREGSKEQEEAMVDSQHVSLRVTPDHRMFVHHGDEGKEPAVVVSASSLLSSCQCAPGLPCNHRSSSARFVACAEAGHLALSERGRSAEVQRRLGLDEARFSAFLHLFGYWLGAGSMVPHHQLNNNDVAPRNAVAFDCPTPHSREWVECQLRRCGLEQRDWLRSDERLLITAPHWYECFCDEVKQQSEMPGSSCPDPPQRLAQWRSRLRGPLEVQELLKRMREGTWMEEENGEHFDDALPAQKVRPRQCIPHWMLMELSPAHLRLVVQGLRRVHSSTEGNDGEIVTADVHLRDQLIQALLHCGLSPFTTLSLTPHSNADQLWSVQWTEPTMGSKQQSSDRFPSFELRKDISVHPYDALRDGRIWCVTVDHPDHLIFAQRAQRNEWGVVTQQSRPIITGQCLQSADRRPSAKDLLEQKVFDLTEPVKSAAIMGNAEIKQVGGTGTSSTAGGGDIKDESIRKKEANDSAANSTKLSVTVTARPDSPAVQVIAPPPVVSAASISTSTQPTVSIPPAASVTVPSTRSPTLRGLREGVTPPHISPASSPHARAEPIVDGLPAPNLALATPSAPSSTSSIVSTSSTTSSLGISAGLPSRFDPRRDLLRQRAEALIPKVSVSKTAELSVVSIVLYVHFPSQKELKRARKERKLRQEQTGAADASDHGEDSEEDQHHPVTSTSTSTTSSLQSSTAPPSAILRDCPTQPTTPPQPLGHTGGGTIKDITDVIDFSASTSPSTSSSTSASTSTSSVSSLPPSTPISPVNASAPVTAATVASTPPLSLPSSPVTSTELTPIHINSYDFSRDNYLAVATDLVHNISQFSLLEVEGVEELVAFRIEEGTRERYNKWQAKARTTLNSEIMTLLTSLGIGLNYAVSFIEQEVSIEDLLYLSEEDLAAFIPKLGPRRRLQQYIAEVKATKRLQEVVEEEEEVPESEEERGEEKKRGKKGGKDKDVKDRDKDKEGGKGEKKPAKEGKGGADKEKGGTTQASGAGQKAKKEREKEREKDKDREREKEERTKEKGKEKPKGPKKDEEEGEAQPKSRDRVTSVNAKPSKAEKEKMGATGGGSGGEKKEKVSASKGEVERDRGVEEKKKKKESREVEDGTLLMDRVDRTLRERKLAVTRPSSALSNNPPSAPTSPHSARSDSGSEHGGERSSRGTKREDGRGGEAEVESREGGEAQQGRPTATR